MAEIRTLAIIGAGSMGWSIACATALAGYRTIVENIFPASLRQANNEIRSLLDQSMAAGRASRAEADVAFGRLQYASTVEEAARQADLVIETVPDDLESKLEIFTLLDKISKPHTIFACTTATLSVAEIAGVIYRANRIIGLRVFNPLTERERLEIVRTVATDHETVAACVEVGQRMSRNVAVIDEAAPAGDPSASGLADRKSSA